MDDREQFIAQKQHTIEDILNGIQKHLDAVDDLFQILGALQDELVIWDYDPYGDLIKTHLSALPAETQKVVEDARQRFAATKDREETERRLNNESVRRRNIEAKILRQQAKRKNKL